MKLSSTALLASVANGQNVIYINAGEQLQKVQCFPDARSLIGMSTVTIDQCGKSGKAKCPELQITDDGVLLFRNWTPGQSYTTITCRKGNNELEEKATIAVLQPPKPDSMKITGGFDQHVDFDEDELEGRPKDFVDFAQCNAGYAFPAAKMKWTNTVNGDEEKCDLGPTDMSGCEKDHDESGLLESVTLPLNFKLKKGDYASFECEISYFMAENGTKKAVSQTLRYPESEFITYGEVDYPDTDDDDDVTSTTSQTVKPDEEHGSPADDSNSESHDGDDVPVETGNALLGTASGIIILAIIIGLIFFVRKRSRNQQNESGGEYKSGSTVASA